MAILTNSLLIDISVAFTFLAFLFYKFWTRKYDYWKKRGVAYIEPRFPLGTRGLDLLRQREHFGAADQKLYNQFKGERYGGIFSFYEPEIMLRDPELIKNIMTRDFNNFTNRGFFPKLKHDFLNDNLFNMEGDEWKRMRSKLSPTFTSGKMKFMFNLIEVVAQQLSDYLQPLAAKSATVEVKDVISRFNTDVIATCAFGLEVNSLKNPDTEFRNIGRMIVKPTKFEFFKVSILLFMPVINKIFPIVVNPPRVSNFILNVVKDTIEFRQKKNVVRNDFIDLLTGINEKTIPVNEEGETNGSASYKHSAGVDDELNLKEMAAQVFVFFAAGFETSSSITSFCLFELSKHKEIQDKVCAEIDAVIEKNGGKVTYQALQEVHYLDKCINETLRRYASLPFLRRECIKTYKMPDSDLVIEKGVKVLIPTYCLHHDPEHYPDPFKFDPERFSEDGINSRHHYTFLPFGEGPRVCIGKRLGMMQVKMAVITILKDFFVTPAPGLPEQLPIDPSVGTTSSAIPIQLIFTKRQ